MKKFLFSMLLGLSVTGALACTPGAGNGPSGDPNCMGAILNHDPYYNGSQQNTSRLPKKIIRHVTVNVPSKYGALAWDKKTGSVGGAINADSLSEAKKAAIRRCGEKGCKVITSARNGCIAAATGKKGRDFMLSRAVEAPGNAESVAMERCKATGASNCQIIIPESCSVPDGMYD